MPGRRVTVTVLLSCFPGTTYIGYFGLRISLIAGGSKRLRLNPKTVRARLL